MKKKLFFCLLLILIGSITSCQDDLEATNEPIILGSEPVNFYKNKAMFDEASRLRSDDYSSPFSIDHIQRTGDTLKVEVSYAKGCEGTFHVIWDGAIMESYPMQATLFLKFQATGCPNKFILDETVRKVITIDLVGFIGDEQLVKETIFHVANASSLQGVTCEGNCDETVSNG
ncbi:MAG: hypothetical protein HC819_04770 [Cyclobacteriaceae bacterium]|nr:hypothetical protein [Cyclobacteriaceae bacterium]